MVDGQREVFNPNIGTSIPDPNPGIVGSNNTNGAPQAGGKGGVGVIEAAIAQQALINEQEANFPGLEINGILGGLPVAEKNQEYFVVFDEAGDTSPEIPNQTQFKVIYIVDSKLNVGKPAYDTVALSNIKQNFEPQKFATVRADQGTALNPQLVGTYPITAVGSIAPIIGTQIGKGPLQYVTTMSFQLTSQIGLPGGLSVTSYDYKREKTWGRNDILFARSSSGQFSWTDSDGTTNLQGYNLLTENPNLNPPELEMGSTGSYRVYYDFSSSFEDGEGVSGSFSGSYPSFFNVIEDYDYNNEVYITTGSLVGNTRVKIGSVVAVGIATSSVLDIWQSDHLYNNGAGVYGEDLKIPCSLKLSIIAEEEDGTINVLAQTSNSNLNAYNPSAETINSMSDRDNFAEGALWQGFNWNPTYEDEDGETRRPISWVGTTTGYIDLVSGSKVYSVIEVIGREPVGPVYPPWANEYTQNPSFPYNVIEHTKDYITGSLDYWKDTALFRSYQLYWAKTTITPEYTQNRFIDGVVGLTASYYDTQGSSSLYNYTGSYWKGITNTTSSNGENICYVTASTKLAKFYGGEYLQVNPGTEVYNNYNLEILPSSSLNISTADGTFKKDWINAGFNPLRLPFIIQVGDYIRFEYSLDKTFQIIGVFSSGNRLHIKLNKHVPSSTVLDNFVIYRIIDDGQYIILDVEKDIEAGINQAFKGIILPEYPSEATTARQDELIFELKKAGVIEDGTNNSVTFG